MPGQSVRKVDGGRIAGAVEITNVVQIKFVFTLANQKQATASVYGQHEGSFVASTALANQLFTAISGHWLTRLGTYLNANIQFTALTMRDMTKKENPEYRSTSTAVPSGGTSPALPQDVALVLTGECTQRGRGAKSRAYIPGWGTAALGTNGAVNPAAVTALTGWGTDIRTDLNAIALTSCVARPGRQEYTGLTGAHHDARDPTYSQVTAYVCQNAEFDTQRRRGI